MRRVYIIPSIVTAFNLVCGLFVIFKVNMVEPGMGTYQVLQTSVYLLLLAAFADLIDGFVARVMHAESEFGFMFDSLADAVSFGVAPAVLLLKSLSLEPGTGLSFFALVSAMIFSLCGILRLVRFNVKSVEVKKDAEAAAAHKKHFTGLPIPAAALAAVSAILFLASPMGQKLIHFNEVIQATVLPSLIILLGYFMVCRLKFPSAKVLHFRIPSFQLVFFAVLFAIAVLYGILYFFPPILLAFTWSYVILGLILAVIRRIAGKKSKTLEEFEPDNDD